MPIKHAGTATSAHSTFHPTLARSLVRGAYHYRTAAYRVNCGFCLYRNLQWGGWAKTSKSTTTREILSPRSERGRGERREREQAAMIPQAEFHLSSNNDAHHIRRPLRSVCATGWRDVDVTTAWRGTSFYICDGRGRTEISEGERRGGGRADSNLGNIKNSTTPPQECRVGFHGKCRRYGDQREFSSDSPALSLYRSFAAARVCVLHLRTEKLTSADERGRQLFV